MLRPQLVSQDQLTDCKTHTSPFVCQYGNRSCAHRRSLRCSTESSMPESRQRTSVVELAASNGLGFGTSTRALSWDECCTERRHRAGTKPTNSNSALMHEPPGAPGLQLWRRVCWLRAGCVQKRRSAFSRAQSLRVDAGQETLRQNLEYVPVLWGNTSGVEQSYRAQMEVNDVVLAFVHLR